MLNERPAYTIAYIVLVSNEISGGSTEYSEMKVSKMSASTCDRTEVKGSKVGIN